MSYLTFVLGFGVGVLYKAGKLDGVILWGQRQVVGWYAWATKKEPKT